MPDRASETHVIVFAPAMLQREAWRALLDNQHFIEAPATVCEVGVVGPLVEDGQPTTILVDLPELRIDLAHQLHEAAPDTGVLFLVDDYRLETVLPLLRAGAAGCITRDGTVPELVRAIIAAGRGEIALPPDIAGQALTALARGETAVEHPVEELTEREVEVLHLLAEGMMNKDIAQTLLISVRTVEAHMRNVYGKLGVESRTEAALWAVRNGYASAG
jgi:NarL family two-component system response regulator LiaR